MEEASETPVATGHYSRVAMALHWAVALLILVTIPLGVYGASSEAEAAQTATNTHKSIGILILALTLVRVAWRLTHKPPLLPATMKPVLRWIAKATHILFYVLLLVLPLSGWWMSSAVPKRHPFGFGLFEMPFLPVPRGFASAGPAHFIHVNLGFLMIGLVVLHFLAVLKHWLIDDDDVIARMLPRVS